MIGHIHLSIQALAKLDPLVAARSFGKKSLQIMFYAFPNKKVVEVCEFS
jgi:hypothetical protein